MMKKILKIGIKLLWIAIFPHIGLLLIWNAAHASDDPYRLVIKHPPSATNKVQGSPKELYRTVCGLPEAIEWAKGTIFKGEFWHPVKVYNLKIRERRTRTGKMCDSFLAASHEIIAEKKIEATGEVGAYLLGKNPKRVCVRIEGCAINIKGVTEAEYCPSCVWRSETEKNSFN